jgi:hypothetical protein
MKLTKKEIMVFGLFLLTAFACYGSGNNDNGGDQFAMAGTAWTKDAGLYRVAYDFFNETEFNFYFKERVRYSGTYRVDGQKVLLFPEDGFIINEYG